jgi:hypothetical protein
MLTFIWFLVIASAAVILAGAPSGEWKRKPSWFDLVRYMTEPKKPKGRAQQTAAHRKRKTRR